MKTAPTKRMIAKITKLKGEISAKRDELRELTSELEQVCEDCDSAIENLESAADSLRGEKAMQFYRCKCGSREAWGLPPYACASCEKCGSDLAQSPDSHRDPAPHDFSDVEKIKTDQGDATITRCRYCHRTEAEVSNSKAA